MPITLYQALPKGDKLELIIQKTTELGVGRVVPVAATRSVVQLKGDRAENKVARWQKIAQEAAEQCERGKVPVVDVPEKLADVRLSEGTLGLILSERVVTPTLPQALPGVPPMGIALFVGPEGGWTAEELSYWFRRLQTGLVQNYALLMLAGVVVFVGFYWFMQ